MDFRGFVRNAAILAPSNSATEIAALYAPASALGLNYGLMKTGVPLGTSPQISSISLSVTAMQPRVQS
jgi:hypothetical protein